MSKPGQDFLDIDVNHEHLSVVRKAMFDVVNSNYRKGLGSIQIAGKTGTPEINSKGESHKLFIAYGPYHDPRYAISVFIEHGKTPRQDVAIASEILQYMLEK